MIAIGNVEARPRSHQHVLALQQIESEGLVVERLAAAGEAVGMHADEGIHRPPRWHNGEIAAPLHRFQHRGAGGIEPAAGPREIEDRLVAAERRLHGVLAGHVRAEAERREQFHCLDIVPCVLPLA